MSLIARIHDYEAAQEFDLPGSYGGLEPPDADKVADWVRYLLGEVCPEFHEPSNGTTWLLGCGCSVAGCWPLEARVTVDSETVTWDRFRQPHRPKREYACFGPFVFAHDEYEQAIRHLAATLATDSALSTPFAESNTSSPQPMAIAGYRGPACHDKSVGRRDRSPLPRRSVIREAKMHAECLELGIDAQGIENGLYADEVHTGSMQIGRPTQLHQRLRFLA